ncbi:unnamed protein product [Urochloa decumbens]|uniref:F-box protein AT5G49610-like beta-propeller domain-containing protein n=1 Tax=Urochloa decumbens TaxID=240449 RepID=A0ABC9BAG1_9POAL
MAPPPRPPPALMDELVEEIALRIPPDDPARLLRAALVCKRWWRVISDPGFRRRFREFHRTPPMLGFLRNLGPHSTFVATSSFRPTHAARWNCPAVDARHGRVLLHVAAQGLGENPLGSPFVVWDPITGDRRELPLLRLSIYPNSWNAAVLCASPAGACDHLDCHRGPFQVVFVSSDTRRIVAYVFSSEAAAWSKRASVQLLANRISLGPSALIGNVLYFMFFFGKSVLKYDLGTREMSVVQLPPECWFARIVPMTTEDGRLGVATVVNSKLYLWSRDSCPDGDAGWVQSRVIELEKLLPNEALSTSSGGVDVDGIADGIAVIFLRTDDGVFTIDLKSCQVKKVYKDSWIFGNFPFLSFYTPCTRHWQQPLHLRDKEQAPQMPDKHKILNCRLLHQG